MNQSQQVRSFRTQVELYDDLAIALQFAPARGEYGYRIPGDIGVERDAKAGNALVLTWLDVVHQNGVTSGREAPSTADCLLEFVSLGIDGRWEASVRQPGSKANTSDGELARAEAVRAEEDAVPEVLKFARKRGPLALWPYQVSLTVAEGAYRLSEPVYYYWGLARRMRTLLRLAQHLRDPDRPHDTRPAKADLEELLGREPEPGDAGLRGELGEILTRWMRCAQIHPALVVDPQNAGWQHGLLLPNWWMGFDWDDSQEGQRRLGREYLQPGQRYKPLGLLPREEQRPSPVFAVLVMQLAALMASPHGILQCGICQRLFQPTRKPRTDREYLRTCGSSDCKQSAHNRNQNASNRRRREKGQPSAGPEEPATGYGPSAPGPIRDHGFWFSISSVKRAEARYLGGAATF